MIKLYRLAQVRTFTHKILVANIPKYWDTNDISSRFSTVG